MKQYFVVFFISMVDVCIVVIGRPSWIEFTSHPIWNFIKINTRESLKNCFEIWKTWKPRLLCMFGDHNCRQFQLCHWQTFLVSSTEGELDWCLGGLLRNF
jgi:hypothetical protein